MKLVDYSDLGRDALDVRNSNKFIRWHPLLFDIGSGPLVAAGYMRAAAYGEDLSNGLDISTIRLKR